MQDKYYVVYDNIGLTKNDVSNFDEGCYVNDLNISFYFRYIHNKNIQYEDKFCLLDPAMSQTLYYEDDIECLKMCLECLKLNEKQYIFLPVNDNTDKFKQGGGSHWALLVYQKENNVFFYLDSMGSYIKTATKICKTMLKILDIKIELNIVKLSNAKLQENYCDCGVFLLSYAEFMLEKLNQNKFSVPFDDKLLIETFKGLDQSKVKDMRLDLKRLVDELRSKKI